MVYKEVSWVEITEVIRQWQAGRSMREITRSTGLPRHIILKYIPTAQSCGLVRDEYSVPFTRANAFFQNMT